MWQKIFVQTLHAVLYTSPPVMCGFPTSSGTSLDFGCGGFIRTDERMCCHQSLPSGVLRLFPDKGDALVNILVYVNFSVSGMIFMLHPPNGISRLEAFHEKFHCKFYGGLCIV